MSRQKLDADQRVYIYVGTEEADDTDKTLMAGNIKQAYIDSSLSYYHDLIARGVDLENIKIHIQSGAEHNEELGLRIYQTVFAFSLKSGTSLY